MLGWQATDELDPPIRALGEGVRRGRLDVSTAQRVRLDQRIRTEPRSSALPKCRQRSVRTNSMYLF